MLATGRGSVIVSGRWDSTLNRNGVRLGSADLCDVVGKLPEVAAIASGASRDAVGDYDALAQFTAYAR